MLLFTIFRSSHWKCSATLLKRSSKTGVFLWNSRTFWEHLFWRTSENNCSYIFIIILIIIITIIIFTTIAKSHLYHLRILLSIPVDCKMITCLFQLNFVFFLRHISFHSVIPSLSFFTRSKRTQNSFTTSRQILDVLFILIFISIVICTSLFTLTW